MSHDPSDAEAETPWAQFQRMRAEGHSFGEVLLALKERGLDREELELLTQGVPELQSATADRLALSGCASGADA
jgi:hypothetical protein